MNPAIRKHTVCLSLKANGRIDRICRGKVKTKPKYESQKFNGNSMACSTDLWSLLTLKTCQATPDWKVSGWEDMYTKLSLGVTYAVHHAKRDRHYRYQLLRILGHQHIGVSVTSLRPFKRQLPTPTFVMGNYHETFKKCICAATIQYYKGGVSMIRPLLRHSQTCYCRHCQHWELWWAEILRWYTKISLPAEVNKVYVIRGNVWRQEYHGLSYCRW